MKIKFPKNVSEKKMISFFYKHNLLYILENTKKYGKNIDRRVLSKPHAPVLSDLYRIHQYITLNKRTTVLEYGTGWSTLVISKALFENEKKFKNKLFSRIANPFKLFVLDNEKKYLKISKKRLFKYSQRKLNVNFYFSNVKMTTFNDRISTEYLKHPKVNPDFIFLDGPDQFKVKGHINNISTNNLDMMPMSCDILKYENFLTPGTIILTDGRSANARFLKNNFQRNWDHKYIKEYDENVFLLNEEPLGKYNYEQIKFYNN